MSLATRSKGVQTIRVLSSCIRQADVNRRSLITHFGAALLFLAPAPAAAFNARHHHSGPRKHTNTQPHETETTGIASFYGREHNGGPTASGERFNMHAMTAAHRTLPFGTRLKVTNLANGKTAIVRINDRGPYSHGRLIDLSQSAAEALGFIASGTTRVHIEPA